jgi:hypothetical protein
MASKMSRSSAFSGTGKQRDRQMVPCGPSSWRGRIHGHHGREDGGPRARCHSVSGRASYGHGAVMAARPAVRWGHGCRAATTTAARGGDDSGRTCADNSGKDDVGRRRQRRRGVRAAALPSFPPHNVTVAAHIPSLSSLAWTSILTSTAQLKALCLVLVISDNA